MRRLALWGLVACLGCSERPASHAPIEGLQPSELQALVAGTELGVAAGGRRIEAPPAGPLVEGDEIPMRAGPGDGQKLEEPGRRSPAFRPDRVTQLEGEVGYFAVFTPSIAPFKRVSALDAVVMLDGVPALGVGDAAEREVPVEGPATPAPDGRPRDRFWGSVVLDFSEGRRVPLPTVSPESRILELRTEPEVELQVVRDGADNFYAVAPKLPPAQVRVTYMIDAPRTYFGASLPDDPSDTLAGKLFPMPPEAAAQARTFAAELGLERGMPVDFVLETLARHFRDFVESREPPEDSGHIYLDLARGKRGICRHRAYAFVITAIALGIPARFVQNEAHAWVEVQVPTRGFMRLDLGGAPHGLTAHGTDSRVPYQPEMPDPWPRPPAYVEAEAEARSAGQMAESGQTGAPDQAAPSGRLEQGGRTRRAEDDALKPTLAEGQGPRSSRPRDEREAVRLKLTTFDEDVLRGKQLSVRGRAETLEEAEPVADLRIEVSLAEPAGEHAVLLGVAVTDAKGGFEGAFAVPPDLPPADYKLVVVTPGDTSHAAARAP